MRPSILPVFLCAALSFGQTIVPNDRVPVTDSDWTLASPGVPGVAPGVAGMVLRGRDLYVAGAMRIGGATPISGVARWDGANWTDLGFPGLSAGSPAMDPAGNLYVVGTYPAANGRQYRALAKWDGSSWTQLGRVDFDLLSVAVDRQGLVYIGGLFDTVGGVAAKNVARWDGKTWSALGSGTDSAIRVLTTDDAGNLYAGGDFIHAGGLGASRVAKWDGASWTALGTGVDNSVYSLAFDHGSLYVGGPFTKAGGLSTGSIARWDGMAWASLGAGALGDFFGMSASPRGGVDIAGIVRLPGGVTYSGVAHWDGTAWSGYGQGIPWGLATAVVSDSSGRVFASGGFSNPGADLFNIGVWDGVSWKPLWDKGINGPIWAMAKDSIGNIYLGGEFTRAGGVAANHIVRRTKTGWEAMGDGFDGIVLTIASDRKGNVYAGGSFRHSGSVEVDFVARWDGKKWQPLGTGMDTTVLSLVVDDRGNLVAGGSFQSAGGTTARAVARWDGSAWSPLGAGLGYGINSLVPGDSGTLYAGGGSVGLVKWNGSSWVAIPGCPTGTTNAMARNPDGTVYLAGYYSGLPNTRFGDNVVSYRNGSWYTLGQGFANTILSLATDGHGGLYAGGAFRYVAGQVVGYMARYSYLGWTPMGSGVDDYVRALLVDSGLYVGGQFTLAGGRASPFFAKVAIPTQVQAIDLAPVSSTTYGDPPFRFHSTSGLPVRITLASGTAVQAKNDSLFVASAGKSLVHLVQLGDNRWLPTDVETVLVVARKPVSIGGAKALDKVYDGNTTAKLQGGSLVGVLPPDVVELVLGNATFDTKDTGKSKPVTVAGSSLRVPFYLNYELAEFSGLRASIHPAPLRIAARDTAKRTTDPDPIFHADISGLVAGETDSVVHGLVLRRDTGSIPGRYRIAPSGAVAANYSISYGDGTLMIDGPTSLVARQGRGPLGVAEVRAVRAMAVPGSGPNDGGSALAAAPCGRDENCLSVESALPGPASVDVAIFDNAGSPVVRWSVDVSEPELRRLPADDAGRRVLPLRWNLRSASGRTVAGGVYLWKIEVRPQAGLAFERIFKVGVAERR